MMKKLATKKMWEILEWYRDWESECEDFIAAQGIAGLGEVSEYVPFDAWLRDQVTGGVGKRIYEENNLPKMRKASKDK
jgi:hypothetical protein